MPPISYATYATPRADLGEAVLEFDPAANQYISELVFPERAVGKKAGTLSVKTRENRRNEDVLHSNRSTFNRVNAILEDLPYECKDYGLEAPLSDTDREDYADDFDAELETVDDIQDKIAIAAELRTKDILWNDTTWDSSDATLYTNNSSSPWDDATEDIIGMILDAKEIVRLNGYIADTLIVGEAVLVNMLQNTGIKGQFKGVDLITEALLRQSLPSIFGLKQLIVGRAAYNAADLGQDYDGTDIWGDDYAMVCKLSEGSLRRGGLGRTFKWSRMSDAYSRVVQYREEQSESDIFRVRQFQEEKVLDKYAAHLMLVDA